MEAPTQDFELGDGEGKRVRIKGKACYVRLKVKVLAIELTEKLQGLDSKPGDFILPDDDGEGGTLYSRDDFLDRFETIQFVDKLTSPFQ